MIDIKEIGVVIATTADLIADKLKAIVEPLPIIVKKVPHNKEQMIDQIKRTKPDVVLLDVALIEEDDEIITEIVMLLNIPLIILSSGTVHHTAKTVNAITNGASDFILYDNLDSPYYQDEVINKILHVAASLTVNGQKKSTIQLEKNREQKPPRTMKRKKKASIGVKLPFDSIVAIGTSTGGPKALQFVLSSLPKTFPAPIVIVQHMPSGFTKSLADRLDNICRIRVKEAVDGEKLKPATAYIAPGNYHMIVNRQYEITTFIGAERGGHRPSVNTLFESVAELEEVNKLAIILTGMGKDGAIGVRKMKEKDKDTIVIVESEETAVIHGMPKAAIQTGCVTEVVRLEHIGERIIHHIMKRGK